MCGSVPRQAFEPFGDFDEFLDPAITLNQSLQVGTLIHRLLERNVQLRRNQFGDSVDFGIGHLQAPARISNDATCSHSTESDDLRNILAPVLFCHVIDNSSPPVHAKIDIDIRQRHALGIEKTLEEKSVLQRIQVSYPHTIGNQTACGRTTAGAYWNVVFPSVPDKIPNNQEVSRVLHSLNDPNFFFQAGFVGGKWIFEQPAAGKRFQKFQPVLKTVVDDFRKVGVDRIARRNCEFRKGILNLLKLETAAFGDLDALIEDEGKLAEYTVHFFSRLEVELIRVKLHPVWIVDSLSRLDTQQNVMGPAVILLHVVTVVGCDRTNSSAFRDLQHIGNDFALFLQAVIVDLQEETVSAENVQIFAGRSFGLVHAPAQDV